MKSRNQVEYYAYKPIYDVSNSFRLVKISGNFNEFVRLTDKFIEDK